ncbi:MAG: type VI secretion system baseplate subunit TssK [Bryobacterales bacterium]|nr:type VI secretion system baseplate subunit TssK [Bryobacteraceae bacterium]MDW8131355.1 type VI secretion system baseplate subunit TssK [Bryobacterales bacterium]
MRRLQPVVWTKGTILTPQHLQSQDLFFEQNLQFRLEALNFRPWGFRTLGVNQEALQAGVFAISRAEGILPDGLLFDIPDSDPAPPPKPLADYFEGDVESVDLYLAIPRYRERGLNVAPGTGSADARYVAEVAVVRDENWDRTERPIQIARKNFRLLAESETRQGASFLRIARVRRTPAGLFELDPRFVPPLLDIGASDYLMAILRRLVEILAARSSMLAGMRRQKNQSLADFTSADIANFWLLYTINSHFPLLRHLFETRRGHPEALFQLMTSLAGALTTFSLKIQPRDLPVYDHEDLGPCFTDLDEKLRLLLETVVPANFVSLPLKQVEPSIYATALAEERHLANTRMYLAIQAEMNEADLIAKAPLLIKVCSATHIEHLIRQALPGVRLIHTPQPPASIPIKLNYQYFALNQSGGAWEAICRARNFAAYVPADFPNPQLELIILLPQAS